MRTFGGIREALFVRPPLASAEVAVENPTASLGLYVRLSSCVPRPWLLRRLTVASFTGC